MAHRLLGDGWFMMFAILVALMVVRDRMFMRTHGKLLDGMKAMNE
ncbi:MAG TPA: hypothetical protein VFO10_18265 [Oligoflexus sp.]|nr:hypothetical protein [Oligoflexus sp.]HET9239211.1 hypothetical protein [Oligoflexus sp.]